MSPIFARLYQQAIIREHPKLMAAHALVFHVPLTPTSPEDILSIHRAATRLVETAIEFDQRLRVVSDRNRMRRPRVRLACPICNEEHCAAAELSINPGTAHGVMLHLLAGGTPLEYDT